MLHELVIKPGWLGHRHAHLKIDFKILGEVLIKLERRIYQFDMSLFLNDSLLLFDSIYAEEDPGISVHAFNINGWSTFFRCVYKFSDFPQTCCSALWYKQLLRLSNDAQRTHLYEDQGQARLTRL